MRAAAGTEHGADEYRVVASPIGLGQLAFQPRQCPGQQWRTGAESGFPVDRAELVRSARAPTVGEVPGEFSLVGSHDRYREVACS